MVLEALCGVTQAKEQNSEVRVTLAESIELLVREENHLPQALQTALIHEIGDCQKLICPVQPVSSWCTTAQAADAAEPMTRCCFYRWQATGAVKSCGT